MSYELGAWYDPLVSAVTGGASSIGRQAASAAAPELVSAVRTILPDLKTTLSTAIADGANSIKRDNLAVFIGFGVALGFFTIGSLGLMYAQYRRLGKCCPTGK